jgi:hypothetical protein
VQFIAYITYNVGIRAVVVVVPVEPPPPDAPAAPARVAATATTAIKERIRFMLPTIPMSTVPP